MLSHIEYAILHLKRLSRKKSGERLWGFESTYKHEVGKRYSEKVVDVWQKMISKRRAYALCIGIKAVCAISDSP